MTAAAPIPAEALTPRLAWLTALRLGFLALLLGAVTVFYFGERRPIGSFSLQFIVITIALAFASAGACAAMLKANVPRAPIAYAQLVVDQLVWSAFAYVSGGVASGATSFYGLTCVAGAVLVGVRGVVVAALAALVLLAGLSAGFASGLLAPPADQTAAGYPTRWAELTYPLSLNLLVLTIVALLAGYLAERLRDTGGALVVARARAEEAERLALLGRFAAGLAHEIRNPLGSIAGSIDLIASAPALSDDERLLCGIIASETARLNDLVGDMLQLARPRPPEPAPVDAAAVAREVVALAARSGRGSDLRVVYEGPKAGVLVLADGAQLRQLLWNLVRNAVQASAAADRVLVTVAQRPEGGAVIEVVDHGPGISESARVHLFDAFFTTRAHGVGIGLAVVKRVVEAHGWGIEVESAGGGGATFRVLISPSVSS